MSILDGKHNKFTVDVLQAAKTPSETSDTRVGNGKRLGLASSGKLGSCSQSPSILMTLFFRSSADKCFCIPICHLSRGNAVDRKIISKKTPNENHKDNMSSRHSNTSNGSRSTAELGTQRRPQSKPFICVFCILAAEWDTLCR